MSNVATRNFLYLLLSISAVAWFALAYFNDLDLSKIKDFFGLIPKVVSIDLLVIGIFVKWGWKLKMFRGWLVPFPNLSGTWVGYIYSEWKNPETGEQPDPIPVMLSISQTFFNLSCVMRTQEMVSHSYAEGFQIDLDRQIRQLAYSYTSKPRLSLSDRSIPHDGAAVFQIIEKPKPKLTGRYWTERKTIGEIILDYHSKELLEELPTSLGDHPVTEPRNRR